MLTRTKYPPQYLAILPRHHDPVNALKYTLPAGPSGKNAKFVGKLDIPRAVLNRYDNHTIYSAHRYNAIQDSPVACQFRDSIPRYSIGDSVNLGFFLWIAASKKPRRGIFSATSNPINDEHSEWRTISPFT
ncbi:MAG TPA: hypothetical protein PKD64_02010 [Pirellulaceae bacterium]|nr:hypothetical protein [Pirellulaceae bacterium]HMO90945.1 hypothetical protein [Pirellulaceae bacterium]